MIDIASETVVSFADAAKSLPRRRAGKKPSIATLYRWSTIGCRGVILETIQIGATRCTSLEALQRFFSALTNSPEPAPVATRQKLRAVREAEAVLDAAGI